MSKPQMLKATTRPMELADLESVAKQHLAQLPAGFFGSLGERFLVAYYRTYLTSPVAVALIVEVDGQPVGYLVGTVDEASHRQHVIRLERTRLAITGLWCMAMRPQIVPRFVRTRLRKYGRAIRLSVHRNARSQQPRRLGVLHHIAITSTKQRCGVGSELVSKFVSIGQIHSVEAFQLLTHTSNQSAKRFYLKHGWSVKDEISDNDGEEWVLMTC